MQQKNIITYIQKQSPITHQSLIFTGQIKIYLPT